MPLKHPNPAELPPGFVLDPPPLSPPHRNAAPQRRALMGPDYGQNFLRQSLGGSPPEQWRQVEAPKLADRMRQARSLWSQRLAIERERDLAEIESAYMKPEEAPLSLRPIIPRSSRTRNRRLADVREQLNQQRGLIAKEALNLSISPQNDFERKYSAASGLREKAAAIAADPAGAMGALSPSLMAATPEMALQLTLARSGRSIDKGVAAVSGIGFGTKSAYDQEYAAELIHSLARQGVDVRSKQSLQRAMSDAGVMATARSEARRKASIVAAGAGLGGALGTRMLAPSSLPPLGREFANLAAQLPVQTLISSITEAASQWASRGNIEGGDVLLSALGGLAGAPGQIAEAKIGGYRQANPAARDAARIQARQGSDGVGTSENPVGADWKEVIASAIRPAMLVPLEVEVGSAKAGGYQRLSRKMTEERSPLQSRPSQELGDAEWRPSQETADAELQVTDPIEDNLGAARRLNFEPVDYHKNIEIGRKSRGPRNGQSALDSSVTVKESSGRRIGIDYDTGEFVVFDRTEYGTYHGHVRSWDQLHIDMQNALRKAGMADRRGRILGSADE